MHLFPLLVWGGISGNGADRGLSAPNFLSLLGVLCMLLIMEAM